jgi:hypothetical protein
MKLDWNNYLVSSVDNYTMKLFTESMRPTLIFVKTFIRASARASGNLINLSLRKHKLIIVRSE